MNTLEGIAQRRPFHRVVIFLRDASGTYLYLQQFFKSLRQSRTERRHFDLIADLDLVLWASFPFKTSRIRWLPTGTLRKWNPRPACGTAFSSVRISISV